jgi:hypothetical protein
MHHKVLENLITHIETKNKFKVDWIKSIMLLSNTYYRFSEYKCIASFMNIYYPELLLFYPFHEYGKSGIRYRESDEMIQKIMFYCENKTDNLDDTSLTYEIFQNFVEENYTEIPSYIQLEHVQPLEKIEPNYL